MIQIINCNFNQKYFYGEINESEEDKAEGTKEETKDESCLDLQFAETMLRVERVVLVGSIEV